jgi:hypothetical protein
VTCVALSCNVKWVLDEVPWTVLEEVVQEIYEMVCCLRCIVDNLVAVVGRKADSDWLIDAKQMSEMVPAP